jgi:cytochrome d ubiquinol oxidase subunit I
MGVVSGIVMSYQFGTNWSRYSINVGNVVGPLMGYEVLMAFFLEASFLGVMLFGWNRVPPWLHFTASLMVAFGTLLSAFWILAANSWMQYPAGHEIRNGVAYPVDWIQIVFSPTFPFRFLHMVNAAYLTTAIVVLAVGARYLLAARYPQEGRTMMRMGLGMIIVLAPLQLVIGDFHGLNTAHYQPAKLAAIEAHWDGTKPAPFVFFAIPNDKAERNDYEIALPNAGSLLITHSLTGTFPGLKQFPPQDRPPVLFPFWGFRLMVAIGLWFIALAAVGGFLWARGSLFSNRFYLQAAAWSWPLGFVAILSGWITTEVGRQPWVVQGVLRTADAVSPVPAESVLGSLILFIIVYGIIFSAGIVYMNRLIRTGPVTQAPSGIGEGLPSRPITGAADEGRGGQSSALEGGRA